MSNNPLKIICPNCSHSIEIGDAIKQQLENENTRKKDDEIINLRNKAFQLEESQIALQNQKNQEIEDLKNYSKLQLEKEKIRLENELKIKIQKENKELEELRLKLKDDEIYKLKQEQYDSEKLKHEIEKLKYENLNKENELKQKLENEAQHKYQIELQNKTNSIENRYKIELEEKNKEIERQNKKFEELSKSQNRTTVELKGESFEDLIKRDITSIFQNDSISDVPKGTKGADLIIDVKQQNISIGKIIVECKNTANFNKDYIDKLINDSKIVKADLSLIISVNLPADKSDIQLYNQDGVWICRYGYHKEALIVLKDSLLKFNTLTNLNKNTENKSIQLFNYLNSYNFKVKFNQIFNSYQLMKDTLVAEKIAMEKHWKAREKQLELIFHNFNDVKSNIEIIAMNNSLGDGFDLGDITLKLEESNNNLLN